MNKHLVFKMIGITLVIILVVWLGTIGRELEVVRTIATSFGYWGLFALSALSGFNVLVPVPAISLYPVFVDLGFQSSWIISVVSLGMVVGDSIGFVLGRTGKELVQTGKYAVRVQRVFERVEARQHILPYVLLFVYAAISPLPNELLVIPMAFAGYRYIPMAIMLLCGNVVFNTLSALGLSHFFSLV